MPLSQDAWVGVLRVVRKGVVCSHMVQAVFPLLQVEALDLNPGTAKFEAGVRSEFAKFKRANR